MSLNPLLIGLFVLAGVCALLALALGTQARRQWRARRRFAAGHRSLWCIVFLLLGALGALTATALLGYRRLASEALVAHVTTRALGPGHYTVSIEVPDGSQYATELAGDEWQLDARVIKWTPAAVVLGATPLYELDRISGRYRDIEQERATPKSIAALATPSAFDVWHLKQRCPRCLPWVDADYGSAAYLPMVDDGRFTVTLAAAGGLVARPADAATAEKLKTAGW
ncbi:MAG: hypothetical protein ABI082_13625 [Dokdonella sp.]